METKGIGDCPERKCKIKTEGYEGIPRQRIRTE